MVRSISLFILSGVVYCFVTLVIGNIFAKNSQNNTNDISDVLFVAWFVGIFMYAITYTCLCS